MDSPSVHECVAFLSRVGCVGVPLPVCHVFLYDSAYVFVCVFGGFITSACGVISFRYSTGAYLCVCVCVNLSSSA